MKINVNRNAPLAVAKAKGSAAYHWIARAASTACTGPGNPPRPRLARASIAIVGRNAPGTAPANGPMSQF